MSNYLEAMTMMHEAGVELGRVRRSEAEAFLRHRMLVPTDRQAQAMAVVEMDGAVEIAEAEFERAKAYLRVAVAEIARER